MSAMQSDELMIRVARAADGRALAALDRAAWSPLSDVAPRRAEEDDAAFFDERHGPEQYLVAEADGRILGYVRQVPPTPLASNRHVRQIQGLAVAREARGRGLGAALVEAACAAARAAGARRITLRVLGGNTPARRLYERCGFRVEGVLPGEFLIEGAYVDDIWMGRALTD
ncbi:GNAT family N-acetyltransferase [Kitasatospora sp. NPDC059571]|uniref:GNAT family N-acetyltransferase n=1 Tax=Kitasatospora sp. NPDC059571 TaxID=3346871 RepID=UPI0036791F7B